MCSSNMPSKSNPSTTRRRRHSKRIPRILVIVLATLVSGLLGYGCVQVTTSGLTNPWIELNGVPDKATNIISANGFCVVIETVSHKFYYYSVFTHGWEEIDSSKVASCSGLDEPWPSTTRYAPPPLTNVVDIRYVMDQSPADWVVFAVYAVRSDGTVYSWSTSSDLLSYIIYALWPLCCGLIGLAASLATVWALVWVMPRRSRISRSRT